MRGAAVFERLRSLFRSYLTAAGKQAAWNLGALVILTGLTQAAALGTLLLLTNSLGPAGFGIFAFALSLQPYLYLGGTLGIGLVLFREGIQEPENLDQITTAAQAVGLVGSLVVGGLAACAALLAPIAGEEQRLIGLIACGNVAACLALAPLFDVHHRQPLAAVIGLAAEVGTLLAVLTLTRTAKLGLVSVGVVFAVKWWLITAGQFVVYRLAIRPLRPVWCRKWLHRLLRSSLPLAGSTLIASLPANAGIFFVRVLGGETEAGVFGIANQAISVYLLFSHLAIRILQPHVAGPYGLDPLFLRKLIVFTGLFLTLLYLGGLAASAGVILFLLAPTYRAALVPVAILLGAALLLSVGTIASSYLVVLHRERTVLRAQFVAAVVYVVTVVLLVPLLQDIGAAVAAALAAGCGTSWMILAVRVSLVEAWAASTPVE